ncbi:5'-3' exonuclease PLD3-like [Physella acuta]|uniref:5'-3' exonuclease PLD3-like n=1 Tax=Physella acuta TaxID=109671 RepID=UPI0027DDFA37|nr:5'-3' exonuclease PLD3-like [Physella acuta]
MAFRAATVFSQTVVCCLCLFVALAVSQIHHIGSGEEPTNPPCIFTLVESIPENMTYSANDRRLMSTYDAHMRLLDRANSSIHLASFYWTLRGSDTEVHDYSSVQGEDIFQKLSDIVKGGEMDVNIVQNSTSNETDELAASGARVRTINFPKLLNAGVLHTKMWIVDDQHAYIGSANFDWRSYTQVKEIGILIENCPTLVKDAKNIFDIYWYLSNETIPTVPAQLPDDLTPETTYQSPMPLVYYNETQGRVALSSSPPPFCPSGRLQDIDAIIHVIQAANKFIYISVMDYLPLVIYTRPEQFWPVIDNELRKAAYERHVSVYLMASKWPHTKVDMYAFLMSLYDLKRAKVHRIDIQVKLFTVPSTPEQKQIPFARVNHNKFMVTENHAYIGTSNWSGDYFVNTGGVGFTLEEPDDGVLDGSNVREQLVDVFLRDWNSTYTEYVY